MKKQLILLFTLAFAGIFSAAAQDPIYVVNGQVVSDIRNIPPGDIESTEMLPADEQTIARYGTEASNGVILITLRYDTPARFPEADGFCRKNLHRKAGGYPVGHCAAVRGDAEQPDRRQPADQKSESHLSRK